MLKLYQEIETDLDDWCTGYLKNGIVPASDMFLRLEKKFEGTSFIAGLKALGVFSFTEGEQLCLAFLCRQVFKRGLSPIDYDAYPKHEGYPLIRQGKEGLLGRGIIRRAWNVSDNPERTGNQRENYLPTPRTFGLLFHGRKDLLSLGKLSKQAELIIPSDIREKKLFFNESSRDDIARLQTLLDPRQFDAIMGRLHARGRRAAASILLYGPPGTGKTELARQLARATGRDLVIADSAKLFASWHGDTEKNVKELFETYQYVQCISPEMPILLFNEADGLLSRRTESLRQAVDKIENRVQNIFLQALEDFEGIFIATTNLTGNLDPAFERRILFKMHLQLPDPDTRLHIWQEMIPDLEKADALMLASRYEFSGSQIENVATKRDIDIALFDKVPTFAQILVYCDSECLSLSKGNAPDGIDFNKTFFDLGGTVS